MTKTLSVSGTTSASTPSGIVAIVPAAGVGKRMQSAVPKQYLVIGQYTILEHTVRKLLSHPAVEKVVVAISADDGYFGDTGLAGEPRVVVTSGGKERADSVLAGLRVAGDAEWVMVHDAARPCLRSDDLDALIASAQQNPDGALLATPVRDTMKRGESNNTVDHTVCREQLWHALTPQMFRCNTLLTALESALEKGLPVTDEASAIELSGGHPALVKGRADNIKVTQPEDLDLAGYYLSREC